MPRCWEQWPGSRVAMPSSVHEAPGGTKLAERNARLESVLKIGQLVKLVIFAPSEPDAQTPVAEGVALQATEQAEDGKRATYNTRIEDLLPDDLVISWPTDQGVHIGATVDQEVSLEVRTPQGVIRLGSHVAATELRPVPLLRIARVGEWSMSQLRHNVRLETTIMPRETTLFLPRAEGGEETTNSDTRAFIEAINKGELDGQRIKGMILDLSAGGILLASATPVPLGSIVEVRFPLAEGQPDISAMALAVRVVEDDPVNKVYPHRAGCRFLDLSGRDQDNTIKFIFAKQREMRRSGFL